MTSKNIFPVPPAPPPTPTKGLPQQPEHSPIDDHQQDDQEIQLEHVEPVIKIESNEDVHNQSSMLQAASEETDDREFQPTLLGSGSFAYDKKHGFALSWPSYDAAMKWMDGEEQRKGIKFATWKNRYGRKNFTKKTKYICDRGYKRAKAWYERAEGPRSQKTGCEVHLIVKTYPHTEVVLGKYTGVHNHFAPYLEMGKEE